MQIAVCGTVPAAICGVLHMALNPAKVGVLYGIGMCMIYAAWVAICRAFLLERHYTVSSPFFFLLFSIFAHS